MLVFRVQEFDSCKTLGLKMLDSKDKSIKNHTPKWDVMPHFSKDRNWILATRRTTC